MTYILEFMDIFQFGTCDFSNLAELSMNLDLFNVRSVCH